METRITPCLWFDGQAEEAARFYTSVFGNSSIGSVMRYGKEGPGPEGTAMSVNFELDGQPFMALNGGPAFTFTPAVSFFVACDTQAEVDHFWEKLAEGGQIQQCGWLQDRYGVSWQIVPTALGAMLGDRDPERAGRVMRAMLGMRKLDVAELERAYR
jgi:predicted 3-demethylubiquinone-9 3-methyltransferase (glyoxalase superfamily)